MRHLNFCFIRTTLTLMILMPLALPCKGADHYPPDFAFSRDCLESGPTRVCVVNRTNPKPYLEIFYGGYLVKKNLKQIRAYVKLNSKEAFFSLNSNDLADRNDGSEGFVEINKYLNIQLCYRNDRPLANYPSIPDHPVCPGVFPQRETFKLDWYFEPPPDLERDLFSNIQASQKDWFVDLAFVGDDGEWDSRFGQNYHFEFHF